MSKTQPPGIVIHHRAAETGKYVGCPSIVVLPDGSYRASHSHFGPGTRNSDSFIYRSDDRGQTWRLIAEIHGQIWSNLFLHADALYILGTDYCDAQGGRLNGKVVIRKSTDGGETWTEPTDAGSGLLTDEDGYHTAPVPVIVHRGRVWRGMEFTPELARATWAAFVMSAAEDADLLDRDSWTFSERYQHLWSQSQWIEGNVVLDRDGGVVNVLRANYMGDDSRAESEMKDKAAVLHVSQDGTTLAHDRETDLIDMPGGGVKFTIRFDETSDLYWTLANKQTDPDARRNRLYLASSPDLKQWEVRQLLLAHPDQEKHGFQYVDWVFDGEDILYVSRTAFDDGDDGAHNFHDANYLTFHRAEGFRRNAREDLG